jgi:glycosyltransferase involved in cell wall biosynthesis
LPYATVLIERHTLLQADKIIAVSQSVIEDLSSDYGIEKEKIEFVPHGVDTEKFNPHLAGDAIREKYDVRGPLLLCVSRLQPERFAQKLIPMFGNVAKEIPNATLIVVGDGSLRPSLEAARSHSGLSKNIILAGAQDDDLPYFYAAADLYILPGIHPPATKEMTVLEAMASGKAVVYVNRIQKGLNHSYEPDKDAQDKGIIAVEDHKEFANCAVNLLRDEKKRRALGLAARDAVVSNFSWEKAAEKTINVYESLL